MVTKTARTRQPTREMQRRCRRKRRAKMVRRLLYAAAVLLVSGAVAIVLYGGSPLHASAEPQPVAAPADTPAQAEPTAQPAAPGQYVVAIDPGHGGINPNIGVLVGGGISNGQDVYNTIMAGADATGSSSGIVKAASPEKMVDEMLRALRQAWDDRNGRAAHGQI